MRHRVPANGTRMKRRLSHDYDHGTPVGLLDERARTRDMSRRQEQMTTQNVHELALLALGHFAQCGDNTVMSRLVQSLVTPAWKKALIQWCETYAQIQWIKGRNAFRGGVPKDGVRIHAAAQAPFRKISAYEKSGHIGVRVDILWTTPYKESRPCRLCPSPSLPGEDTCYLHHNK